MEISSVVGQSSIGGISQPVIGQRKIENEIRLRDGEVSLLGGMMEDSKTKALSGIPGLSSIPILKYLFAQDTSDHSTNEIVFVIIPHIIRGPDMLHGDEMLDVGTANSIQLRSVTSKPNSAAPAGAATPAPGPSSQAVPGAQNPAALRPAALNQAPQTQGLPTQAATQAPIPGGTFQFDPPTLTPAKGSTFTVNVMLSGGQNVYSVPVQLNYDPNQLQVVNVSNGGFLSQDGQAVALVHRDDPVTGTLQITATRPPGAAGVSGQGAVVTLTFVAKEAGQSALTITRGGARDPAMQPIAMNGAQAAITIQ